MKQTIETTAPAFSGFYASIWEYDLDYVIEDIDCIRSENGLDPLDDCNSINVDYKGYMTHVGMEYCKLLTTLLKDNVVSIDFKEIDSPREYNFTTDKIVCDVTIDTDVISKWVADNREALSEYVYDRFKARDGFIPFYSNDIRDWDRETNGFTNFDFKDGWVYINGILEVMYAMEYDGDMTVYEWVEKNPSEFVTNWDELTESKEFDLMTALNQFTHADLKYIIEDIIDNLNDSPLADKIIADIKTRTV